MLGRHGMVARGIASIGIILLCQPASPRAAGPITVGFIVKTLNNPYWAAMQKAADAEATKTGIHLICEADKYDGDVSTQISEIEDLMAHRASAIIIAPRVSASVAPALERARKAGITVIPVDTAVDPASAADSFVASDNLKGGTEDEE